MRSLKFRAWVNDHWTDFIPTCKTLDTYNASIIDTDGYTFNKDNPFIVEQFTGLKDKHGKEIYEGDIIKINAFDDVYVGTVEYGDGEFYICDEDYRDGLKHIIEFYDYNDPAKDAEVIGNIHEGVPKWT